MLIQNFIVFLPIDYFDMFTAKRLNIKVILYILALILLMPCVSAQQPDKENNKKFSLSRLFKKNDGNKTTAVRTGTTTKDGNPVINADKLFFDYGDVLQGDVAVAVFNITNTGAGELIIYDIETSCQCVDMDLSSKTILPGRSSLLTVKYNTNIVGEIKRSITLLSNDPNKRRLTFLLTGNVILKQ